MRTVITDVIGGPHDFLLPRSDRSDEFQKLWKLIDKIFLSRFLYQGSISGLPKLVLPSGVKNTPNIAIFRMCYGENGTVKFLETLADNVFRHNYSMMQI